MDYQRLQPYPLLTKLSAAVFAGETELAQRILNEAMFNGHEPSVAHSVIKGKRIAFPDRLPPFGEGETNLDDCISAHGIHNGFGKHEKGDGGSIG